MSSILHKRRGFNNISKLNYNSKTINEKSTRKPLGTIDGNCKLPQKGKALAKINQEKAFGTKVKNNLNKIKNNICKSNQTAKHKRFDFPTTPRNLRYNKILTPETPLNSYPFDSPVDTNTPLRRSRRVKGQVNYAATPQSGCKRKRISRSRKSNDGFVNHLEFIVNGIQTLESNSANFDIVDSSSSSSGVSSGGSGYSDDFHVTPDPDDTEISFKRRRSSNDHNRDKNKKATKAKQQIGNLKRSVTRMSLRIHNQLARSASMVAYNAFSKHGSEWNVLGSTSPMIHTRTISDNKNFDWE